MEITKLGFVVSNIGPTQICYDIIKQSNDYLSHSDDVDVCLFWISDGPKPLQPKFACMPLIEAYAFNGHIIATDIHTLSRVMDYPGPNRNNRILFYDYNLDYLRIPQQMRNWDQFNVLYNNDKVDLIARSEAHAEILHSIFRPVKGVVENCDISKLKDLINDIH